MTIQDWQEYIDLLATYEYNQLEELEECLFSIPAKYRKVYALAFAVAAWHPANPNRGSDNPLCILYGSHRECRGCPAKIRGQWCGYVNHPQKKWVEARINEKHFMWNEVKQSKIRHKMKIYADKFYAHLIAEYEYEYCNLKKEV